MFVFKRKSVIKFNQKHITFRFTVYSVYVQNTNPPALLFDDNRWLIGFWHKQNWAVLTDESSYTLMKHHVFLAIQAKLKQPNLLLFGRDGLYGEIQASVWQE